MSSKFLICLLLPFMVFHATFSQGVSSVYSTTPGAYPYLVLIEVRTEEKEAKYVNGALASLRWVLTVSPLLAKEPRGRPRHNVTVYAGLVTRDDLAASSVTSRAVKRLETELVSADDNTYFPNLVLLKLISPFPSSSTVKPAVFNIGGLNSFSDMVGFGYHFDKKQPFSKPLSIPVKSISSSQCRGFFAVEFEEQFCTLLTDPLFETSAIMFYEGALLVDKKNYVTGLLQFTSNIEVFPNALPLMVLVRLSYYQSFWEFHVIEPQEKYLVSDFDDDLKVEPWDPQQPNKGIGLEYTQGGCTKIKEIDLSELTGSTDIEELAFKVAKGEPLITPNIHHQLVGSLSRLQEKIFSTTVHKFYRHKTLKTHLLPITNVAFDKFGKKCLTGSYDRTCKVWDIETGEEIHTLQGHKNVVYAVTFNNQGDKILTGSFDKTCLLWSAESGECKQSFAGHSGEVVAVQFDPQKQLIATASMDTTARLYNLSTGQEVSVLQGHTGEIISLQYNHSGSLLLTGSFDNTLGLWDTRTNSKLGSLIGHDAEISSCVFSQDENLVVSGSLDKSARVWDVRMLTCVHCTEGHQDEVLDVAVDLRSRQLATASSDSTVCLWDIKQACALVTTLSGHSQEVSKVCFNPAGTAVLTASQDHTARLWDPSSGQCLQVLEGHADDVFSCAFSYLGDTIITASKDNTCRIWQNTVNK